MKNKKVFFLIFCTIILGVVLAVGFFYIRNYIFLNALKSETTALSKLDVGSDRYNRKIKTGGDYVLVEKTIKEYMDNYAVLLQDTLKIKDDDKFTKILSYENYEKDGPDFIESLKYLSDEKTVFNNNIEKLLKMADEKEIIKYGEDRISDEYYLSLYRELILSGNMKDKFWSSKDSLVTTRDDINKKIDQSISALTLLATNKNFWKLEDGEIKLLSQNLYDNYMAIVGELNK